MPPLRLRHWFIGLSVSAAAACLAAGSAGLTDQNVTAAKKLYVAKCAKCHRFYEPSEYTEKDWRKWMDTMSRKSKLNATEEKLLRQYLADLRKKGNP